MRQEKREAQLVLSSAREIPAATIARIMLYNGDYPSSLAALNFLFKSPKNGQTRARLADPPSRTMIEGKHLFRKILNMHTQIKYSGM